VGARHAPILAARLQRLVDVAPLVYFRILFGAIMLWEVCRYFKNGWIDRYFILPPFHPGYFGFEWVKPLPGSGMYAVFAVLGVLAACIMTGFLYRWAAPLFFLGFTYVFLLDATRYLNHFYLIVLVSFLLAVLPAHRDFSIDAWRKPSIRAGSMPAWMLGLLRLQIGIPYFYGGLAKLSPDWLRGEPMRMWLAQRTGFPLIGPYFTQDWMVYAFVYGGLLLDLLAVPMLLWPRTRKLALVLLAMFHLLNARLFVIGIFPWMMLAAALIFLPPSTLRPKTLQTPSGTVRSLLYPGDTNWTEEGHRFSWHMKLRDKEGMVLFSVEDSEGTRLVDPAEYLLPHQVAKLVNGPDLILQLAHHIAEDYRLRGHRDVKVYAITMASLNGRKPQPLIDPAVDLAARSRSLRPSPWIVPLR
jgi:vitamin K-dependent gamma-carboxylase